MEIQIPKKNKDRIVVKKTDLYNIGAYLIHESETVGIHHPGINNLRPQLQVVDVQVYLSGQVWVFLPVKFEITTSETVFSNEDEDHHIKLVFSSDLIDGPLEIPPLGTAVLKVRNGGIDDDNSIDLYARRNEEDPWKKVSSGSGNGADMKINNP